MNLGAISGQNHHVANGYQWQPKNRANTHRRTAETINQKSQSALLESQQKPNKNTIKSNHGQPVQNVHGRKAKTAEKTALKILRAELQAANNEILALKNLNQELTAEANRAEKPTSRDLSQALNTTNGRISTLNLFKKNVLDLESQGNVIYKSIMDSAKLEEIQENLAHYDAEYTKLINTSENIYTQSEKSLKELDEHIVEADKLIMLPENVLSSISAKQRISVEKIKSNEETYAKVLLASKEGFSKLTLGLKETKETLDLTTILQKSNHVTLELGLLKLSTEELNTAVLSTVNSLSDKETTQDSLEQNLAKHDAQYEAIIETYKNLCPRFNEALRGLDKEKTSLLNQELQKTKAALHQIKTNLGNIDHKIVVMKNPNGWNITMFGLRNFSEKVRLSPLDKGFLTV